MVENFIGYILWQNKLCYPCLY